LDFGSRQLTRLHFIVSYGLNNLTVLKVHSSICGIAVYKALANYMEKIVENLTSASDFSLQNVFVTKKTKNFLFCFFYLRFINKLQQ
jgi:hypothetical protein